MGKLFSDNLMLSSFALLVANIIPIIGVLLWGWDVTLIIGLYWIENLVIGLLNLPKMWMCESEGRNPLFLSLFFTVHFGMFCGVHGAAIGTIFMEGDYPLSLLGEPALRLTLIGLFLSHFLSFGVNFIGGREYEMRNINTQMKLPYRRIMIMHIVVLIGGALVQFFGQPIFALLVLIALKIGIDLKSHRDEHAGLRTDRVY